MLIADLHIHSKYSRATSKDCEPEFLDLWARKKGIHLLGTGDFTHPQWRDELKDKLIPAEEGFYRLKDEACLPCNMPGVQTNPRFVLSGEISSIYKKNGKTRKVHNVILLPGLEAAQALAKRLERIGNIHSDGRPILGLDSRDLLEITLETCPDAIFIPAHIWTPHFSLFGAFSGFDTIEECFEDLTPYIHALETGLSADPAMIRRLSALDGYHLVSSSDAHSPSKLGREATLLEIDLSYPALKKALEFGKDSGLAGTLEFFPEEGKYHLDGHRNCNLCLTPSETNDYGGKCPICGKKITIGVQHRVDQLADRPEDFSMPDDLPFESLVPLPEVIAGSTGLSAGSKKVHLQYEEMLEKLGPEFEILRTLPIEAIREAAGPCIAEGIQRLRDGNIIRTPGYDGEYGTIQILSESEVESFRDQLSLFEEPIPAASKTRKKALPRKSIAPEQVSSPTSSSLNIQQEEAATASARTIAVVAGPGTGKTKTLVSRITHLVNQCGVKPSEITAVTFTNQAALEMRQRLDQQFGNKRTCSSMTIGTFHAICLDLLSKQRGSVQLADDMLSMEFSRRTIDMLGLSLTPKQLLQEVSKQKNKPGYQSSSLSQEGYDTYCKLLKSSGFLDFDDLLIEVLSNWNTMGKYAKRFHYLCVDEFQDINELQFQLILAWNEKGKNLFVIGDPDQSIYGFRGSDCRCFDRLQKEDPHLLHINLTQNYRSTPEILGCSLSVISQNPGQQRQLEAQRPHGNKVNVITADSEFTEAVYVAKEINRLVGGIDMLDAQTYSTGLEHKIRSFSEISILYRTHRQADVLEKCLRTEGIPYVVAGKDDFLWEEPVQGILGFFRFLLHPEDRLSLEVSLEILFHCPKDAVLSLSDNAANILKNASLPQQVLPQLEDSEPIARFVSAVNTFLPRMPKSDPQSMIQELAQATGLADSASIQKLLEMAESYHRMSEFLHSLMLGQERDLVRKPGKSYAAGAVTLITLHGSKGLEFPVVFICGVTKGCIPLESTAHPSDPEEERRLFYVGMTRAQEELYLLTLPSPSPFLQALPEDLIESGSAGKRKSEVKQLSLFD